MGSALHEARLCRIEQALGRTELCPETSCLFWEASDGVRPGSCAFERVDLSGRVELARWLGDLRDRLKTFDPASSTARRRFFERLNVGRSD
jgi:hypothetical protein